MSASIPAADAPRPTSREESSTASDWMRRLDVFLDRASERLNPILVKESRQAIKSRQFVVTFALVMVCAWGWTLLGLSIQMLDGWDVFYQPSAPMMLTGYFFVFAVPLLVVVPFSAFRSLAGEREDGTLELVTISSLTARQIVSGKLGSAILQMIVYYSAIAPCMAFTYLLRGVDIVTIALILIHTFLISVLLSAIGLLVAALSTNRAFSVLFSLLLLVGLLFGGFFWSWLMIALVWAPIPLNSEEFITTNAVCLSFYPTYLVLVVFAAGGLLSFASDNRSTRLRWVVLVQQAIIAAWCFYGWTRSGEHEFLIVMAVFSGIHWMLAGSMLIGETAQLSPRVRRSLPTSFLGRMFLTWLNPGSGTGYMFTVASLGVTFLLSATYGLVNMSSAMFPEPMNDLLHGWMVRPGLVPNDVDWLLFSFAVWAYVAIYLGIGRLIFVALKKRYFVGIAFTFLFEVLLVGAGAVIPFFIELARSNTFTGGGVPAYSILQTFNWFWTLWEIIDGGGFGLAHTAVVFTVGITAVGVILLNMLLMMKEVGYTREAIPDRVKEDDRSLHPERFADKTPKSPWDEVDEDDEEARTRKNVS